MFQIPETTEARVCSVTNRIEKHGDDDKPAVTLRLEIETANTILDVIDPKIRLALYAAVDGQEQLPGVEPTTPVLRCNSFDKIALTTAHEGWTLAVDDNIDEDTPMKFGGCKVDKFTVDAKQGGSIVLGFRVGTSDVDVEKLGKLAMHNGQSVFIRMTAPDPKAKAIDGSVEAFKADHPDATDLFATPPCEKCGGTMEEDADADGTVFIKCSSCGWTPPPESSASDDESGPQDSDEAGSDSEGGETDASSAGVDVVDMPTASAGKRTARGRAKTQAALAEGMAAQGQG